MERAERRNVLGGLSPVRAVRSVFEAERAKWRWVQVETRAALERAWQNPKRFLTKAAFVAPISFAFYMICLHAGAHAAVGPGIDCQGWAQNQVSLGSGGPLSTALSSYTGETQLSNFMNNARLAVEAIFFAFMVVQITQDLIDYFFQTAGTGTLGGFFGQYGRILLMNLILMGLFTNLPSLTITFFSAASDVGSMVMGTSAAPWYSDIFTFQPGSIADQGTCLQSDIDAQFAELAKTKLTWSWTDPGKSFQTFGEWLAGWVYASLLGASVADIAYLIVAIIFTFTALELFFIGALGMLSLGGMSYRPLWFMPMMYRSAMFGLFMKVAALGAIASLGANEANTWAAQIESVTNFDQLIPVAQTVMYGCIGFGLLAGFMPGIVAKHFHGGYMGPQATMAVGRVGNTAYNTVRGNPAGAVRSATRDVTPSPNGGRSNGSSSQNNLRPPTMSGTP